ncbi:HEPN domain-containing protein [candidate division KSB1 bacterium]|nr:HEPN domain-containing protein [candidate division KSB1 bacterium]
MNEPERLALVHRWLRYAREDLLAAEAMLGQQSFWPRHACWLAQQAAEKALKAVLVYLQIDFPRRHDLDEQRNLIPEGWQVKADHPDLATLTEWAVESRYPGDWSDATEDEARVAVQQSRAVWNSVSADFTQRGIDAEHAV